MKLQRSEGMHHASKAGVLLAMSGRTSPTNILRHLIDNAEELETDVLTGTRSDFKVAAKRGEYLLQMQADELVTNAYPDLCATLPEILEVASSVLVHDHVLDALCKVHSLWRGKTAPNAGASLMRAIVGRLDATSNGTQKARTLVTALLDPFVSAAVQECIRFRSRESAIAETDYEFTFELRVQRTSPELSTKDFEETCYPTSVDSMQTPDRRDAIELANDAGRLVSNTDDAATITTRVDEGGLEPPQKKRRTNDGVQSPSLLYDFLQQPASHTQAAKGLIKKGGVAEQVLLGELNDIANTHPLHHVSNARPLLYQGPHTYGEKADTLIGGNIVRYALATTMHDMAPSHTLTARGISLVVKQLSSFQMTDRIRSTLDLPKSQEDSFLCTVGRASYHQPFEDLRKQIKTIYAPALSAALEVVAPLRSSGNDRKGTRELASRRQHLRDVIKLGEKGINFTLGLTPFEAVMSTDQAIVDAMLSYDLFEGLGIIEHWRRSTSRC
ncbi:hypothetical protein EV715DRAFT_190655 [Schizophyllum commune]